MPNLVQAAGWGLLAGSGLLIGAVVAVAFGGRLSHRIHATAMGFGGGVLIAVLSIDLMDSAFRDGGPMAATLGFLFGATTFCAINWRLAQQGARHRNRCGECVEQPSEADHRGSGLAIAVGALLDGLPESLVIGLSLLGGERIGPGLVAGFFLANVPQGLSGSSGMRRAGRSGRYIFGLWTGILLVSGIAAAAGYLLLGTAAPAVPATILAFAAGAVLAMLAESMIPEAFADAQPFIGLITVIGFLVAFLIMKMPELKGTDDNRSLASEVPDASPAAHSPREMGWSGPNCRPPPGTGRAGIGSPPDPSRHPCTWLPCAPRRRTVPGTCSR